jgi:L-iditol 2-dehydrogenase
LHSLSLATIRPGETVAVIGAGPIGLLTIAALKSVRAGRIWAVEPLEHRRELARKIGADVALEPDEAAKEILDGTGKRGVDCAIDCAAKEQTTNQAIQMTRNAGRVLITGIHSMREVPLEGSTMRRKELTIYKRQGTTSEAAEKLVGRSLKKRQGTTSQAAEKLVRSLKKRQGTTSVVPQAEQN